VRATGASRWSAPPGWPRACGSCSGSPPCWSPGGLAHQGEHGVNYLRYWVDEGHGQIFCLVEAPDADAATAVHREAHGLVADAIYQVQDGV
jgi:hypothetical protein